MVPKFKFDADYIREEILKLPFEILYLQVLFLSPFYLISQKMELLLIVVTQHQQLLLFQALLSKSKYYLFEA